MELFFLCTIIMAAVSFFSIALSQPPVSLSIGLSDSQQNTTPVQEPLVFIEGAYSDLPQPVGMVA